MIIGITGTNAAGKGEASKYLVSKGFQYFSLSDVLREELAVAGKEATREHLIENKCLYWRRVATDGLVD